MDREAVALLAVEEFQRDPSSAAARKAASKVVETNRGLVVSIAKQHVRGCRSLQLADLIQAGCMGLMHAVKKYDPSLSSFSYYSAQWIRAYIFRTIIEDDDTVYRPDLLVRRHRHLLHVQRMFEAAHGRPATSAELAAECRKTGKHESKSMTAAQVEDIFRLRMAWTATLDEFGFDGTRVSRMAVDTPSPDDEFIEQERDDAVLRAISVLPPRELEIVLRRYWDDETLETAGARLGVSRQRAHQVELQAIRRMREVLEERWAS